MTGPRVLLMGPLGSAHVEHIARAASERGADVAVCGWAYEDRPADTLLEAQGIRVIRLEQEAIEGGRRGARRWLRERIAELRPDLVHAHWLPVFGYWAAVAGARPLIATAWGSDVLTPGPRARLKNLVAVTRATVVTADSPLLLDRMRRFGARRGRSALIKWGVDLNLFRPPEVSRAELKRRLGLDEGPLVLSPRSLTPLYNPFVVLDAFELVRERVPDAQLVLKHISLDAPMLAGRALPPGVRVVGNVEYEQLVDYYGAADACVSIPSSDSAPRTVWEAMATGAPCVLSDLPWLDGMLTPGVEALTTEIAPEPVAAAITDLLTDPDLAARVSAAGQARARADHDRERCADELMELYRAVASGLRTSAT